MNSFHFKQFVNVSWCPVASPFPPYAWRVKKPLEYNCQLQSSLNIGEYLFLHIPEHLYVKFAVCRNLNSLVEVYTRRAFEIQNSAPELKMNWLSWAGRQDSAPEK